MVASKTLQEEPQLSQGLFLSRYSKKWGKEMKMEDLNPAEGKFPCKL